MQLPARSVGSRDRDPVRWDELAAFPDTLRGSLAAAFTLAACLPAFGTETIEGKTAAKMKSDLVIESGLEANWRIATANAFLLKAELEKEEAEHGH